jgi:transposase
MRMESVPKNKPYPKELRESAVNLVLEWCRERNRTDGGLIEIGEKLGVHPESVRNWVNRRQTDAGERPGLNTDEREKMKELERENRDLERANEILRRASAYFAQAELGRPWK